MVRQRPLERRRSISPSDPRSRENAADIDAGSISGTLTFNVIGSVP